MQYGKRALPSDSFHIGQCGEGLGASPVVPNGKDRVEWQFGVCSFDYTVSFLGSVANALLHIRRKLTVKSISNALICCSRLKSYSLNLLLLLALDRF